MKFNEAHIRQLQADGKIKGYQVTSAGKRPKSKKKKQGQQPGVHLTQKVSKEKSWMQWNLWYWANEKGLTLEEEYKFHETRNWRFDFVFRGIMVAIEYNGIMSEKSRHTTITGYSGDMDKINAAQAAGYKVLQYTPLNYRNVLRDLDWILKTIKKELL